MEPQNNQQLSASYGLGPRAEEVNEHDEEEGGEELEALQVALEKALENKKHGAEQKQV